MTGPSQDKNTDPLFIFPAPPPALPTSAPPSLQSQRAHRLAQLGPSPPPPGMCSTNFDNAILNSHGNYLSASASVLQEPAASRFVVLEPQSIPAQHATYTDYRVRQVQRLPPAERRTTACANCRSTKVRQFSSRQVLSDNCVWQMKCIWTFGMLACGETSLPAKFERLITPL